MTPESFLSAWLSTSPYVDAYTSGSTGKPKHIHLSKSLMRSSALRTIAFFGLNPSSRLHLCLSCDYIAGKMMVVRAETAHCRLTAEPPSNDPLSDPNLIRSGRISLLAVVPSQLPVLLNNPERLLLVDNILVGGAPIPAGIRHRLARCPIPAWESYGMTETASHVAIRQVTEDTACPFKVLNGISCSLSDAGTLTIESDDFPPITTTDCAEIIAPGLFRLKGRLDNVIISGGIKIHPEMIEHEASDLLAPYQPCYITSKPDDKWGERVVVAMLRPPSANLIQALKDKVGTISAPKEVVILPAFEYTDSGKLIRRKLT